MNTTQKGFPEWLATQDPTKIRHNFPKHWHNDGELVEELSCGEADSLVLTVNTGTEKNAHSLVLMIEYEQVSVIFAGDAQGVTETRAIANFDGNLKTTVLTVSHHGANTVGSNGAKWIDATSPEMVVYWAGSRFDHPACPVLDRFAATVAETREHEERCGPSDR